jgi:hypothetical protein
LKRFLYLYLLSGLSLELTERLGLNYDEVFLPQRKRHRGHNGSKSVTPWNYSIVGGF